MLKIEFGEGGAVIIVGRLDAAQCPAAQAFLEPVEGSVTLDCRGLEYISSAGLGVLLKTQKRVMPTGRGLRLINANRHISDIFRYAGFDKIFEIVRVGD